jgi:hypothetical protein
MRRAIFFVLILAVVPLGLVAAGAQGGTAPQHDGFVGAWRVTVSPPQGEPHPGLLTFSADGTLQVADVPTQPAPPGLPVTTLFFSGGHGVWEPTRQDAAFIIDILVGAENGMPIGTLTLRGTAALESDNQSLHATYTVDFADPTGQVVSTGQGALQGTRIRVEPPGTPTVATPIVGTSGNVADLALP